MFPPKPLNPASKKLGFAVQLIPKIQAVSPTKPQHGAILPKTKLEPASVIASSYYSHLPHSQKTKTSNKQYIVTNPVKTLKMVHIKKIKLKNWKKE